MTAADPPTPAPPLRRTSDEATTGGCFDGLHEIDAVEISRALREGLIGNRFDIDGGPVPIRTDEQYTAGVIELDPLPTAPTATVTVTVTVTVTAGTLHQGLRAAGADAESVGPA